MFLILAIKEVNGRALVVNQEGATSKVAADGIPLRIDGKNPSKLTTTLLASSAEVKVLPRTALTPSPRIQAMLTGPPEDFQDTIGFTDPTYMPQNTKVAMLLEYKDGSPRLHKFLIGGNIVMRKYMSP